MPPSITSVRQPEDQMMEVIRKGGSERNDVLGHVRNFGASVQPGRKAGVCGAALLAGARVHSAGIDPADPPFVPGAT
jgi:hypothetical protein